MQKALAKAQESSRPYYISTTSLDDVKKRLEAEASPIIKLVYISTINVAEAFSLLI